MGGFESKNFGNANHGAKIWILREDGCWMMKVEMNLLISLFLGRRLCRRPKNPSKRNPPQKIEENFNN